MDSCLAASMNPQVLTITTLAWVPSPARVQPPASRRAASSSESTMFLAQPSVTRLTVRSAGGGLFWLGDTRADYGKRGCADARHQARGGRPGGPEVSPKPAYPAPGGGGAAGRPDPGGG